MDGQTELGELLFSADGRLSRTPFLVVAAGLIVLGMLEGLLPSALHWLTGWIVYPALFFSGACVLAKRLHDRGRSGWFAALVLFSLVVIWPYPRSLLHFPFLLAALWGVVELGVLGGEQGANRFGANPLKTAMG